jgi:hypothetical protein
MSIKMLPKFRTTAGSLRTSNRDEIGTWSEPLVITMGKNAFLVSVMGYDSVRVGWNCRIFGYMSSGDIVPDVMTTDENRSKTGAMANEGSKHLWVRSYSTVHSDATYVK